MHTKLVLAERGGFLDSVISFDLTDPVFIGVFVALSIIAVVILLARKRSWRSVGLTAIGGASGALLGLVIVWLAEYVFTVFGAPLDRVVNLIFIAGLAGCGLAVVNLWGTRRLNRVVAIIAIPLFLVTATLGINFRFGLTPTVGMFLHIEDTHHIDLSRPSGGAASDVPLWKSWKAPAGMPAQGETGYQKLPNTISGFTSRPAGLYLPPAAQVENPPALPFVMMMMGQPGDPNPRFIAKILDGEAAKHDGLAPIVLVVDQIGDPLTDPLCVDSKKYGNVQTFLTRDAVDWARKNLNIYQDAAHWTIAGYSNGGTCAITLAAKHPEIWGNVVDISGEEFSGSEHPAAALKEVFGGDQAAYDAEKPANLIAKRKFPQTLGIFTNGSDDIFFGRGVRKLYVTSLQSGMDARYHEIPNGGHLAKALNGGLEYAFDALYPRLGLEKPPAK